MNYGNGKLANDLQNVTPGEHICSIYQYKIELFSQLVTFFRGGLEHNHKCLYITDQYSKEEILEALEQAGIDIQRYSATRQLFIALSKDTYLKDGVFDPKRMIVSLKDFEKTALNEGYAGLRVSGEASWTKGNQENLKKLHEYELNVNSALVNSRAMAICQYDERVFSPEVLKEIILTHPRIIIYGTIYNNIYFQDSNKNGSASFESISDYQTLIEKIISASSDSLHV